MRLSGREVFFLSGTDEHGQKVEKSAADRGVDPQTFVDTVSVNFRDLLDVLNISHDQFIRSDLALRYIVMTIIYLEKISATSSILVSSRNIHRLIITGIRFIFC